MVVKRPINAWKPEFNRVKETMSERPYQKDHVSKTMSESYSCLRVCNLVSGRVYDLRACFTLEGKTHPQLCTPKKS